MENFAHHFWQPLLDYLILRNPPPAEIVNDTSILYLQSLGRYLFLFRIKINHSIISFLAMQFDIWTVDEIYYNFYL